MYRKISFLFGFLFLLFGLWTGAMPAQADSSVLYATPAVVGSGDSSNWENTYTLENALDNAVSGNEVWAAAGTFKPTTGTDHTL